MKITKIYCPHCGRYLGENEVEDTALEKVLTNKPKPKQKQSTYTQKCKNCKKNVYITVELIA